MSRSLHTEPRSRRARRQRRPPRVPRRAYGLPRQYRIARALSERGETAVASRVGEHRSTHHTVPRLVVHRPSYRCIHPLGRADIVRLLRAAGPWATHGLRTIELRRRPPGTDERRLMFGRFDAPGRIVLYEQPAPPWRLLGALPAGMERCLTASGARVGSAIGGHQAIISWPGTTLRDFMLFDVLLHELGHHVIQHESRQPHTRVRRTRDHEAAAETIAARLRRVVNNARPEHR